MAGYSLSAIISSYTKRYKFPKKYSIHNKEEIKLSDENVLIINSIELQWKNDNLSDSLIKCPECGKLCKIITINEIELDTCISCQSLWFDKGELKDITKNRKDVPGDNLRSRKSKYNCPICFEKMSEYTFVNFDNLLVDKCNNDHGIYLESNEIKRALLLSQDLKI